MCANPAIPEGTLHENDLEPGRPCPCRSSTCPSDRTASRRHQARWPAPGLAGACDRGDQEEEEGDQAQDQEALRQAPSPQEEGRLPQEEEARRQGLTRRRRTLIWASDPTIRRPHS